jgi:Cu(I)/Ag(I) efflux system protein CusF
MENLKMKKILCCSFSVLLSFSSAPLLAGEKMDHENMHPAEQESVQRAIHSATGTVTKVDAENRKVTIAHEPIDSLSWPAMTMGFLVKSEELFTQLKVGDVIRFELVKVDKGYEITAIK